MDMLRVLSLARSGVFHEMSIAESRFEKSMSDVMRRACRERVDSLWKEYDELSQMEKDELQRNQGGKSEIQS